MDRIRSLTWLFLGVAAYVLFQPSFAADRFRPTGTFTDLSYSAESGDLSGTELRIVQTRKGYQGILQFAEGGPGEVIVIPVSIDGENVHFEIPLSSPDAGTFQGKISARDLRGKFKFRTGGELEVRLPRKKSYWD